MGEVFLELLNRSITASWLILAVLLLRLLWKNTPKWINCLLWGMVAIRLICPFSMESPISVIPSAELVKSNTVVDGTAKEYIPSIDSDFFVVRNSINPVLEKTFAYNDDESVAPMQITTQAAGMVWLCGMMILVIYAVISRVKVRRLVEEAVCTQDNVYLCDSVASPFVLGVIRPRIYLPSGLEKEEMKHVILHEEAHLKRRDHWWKLLGYLLLSVYWFWPFCWIAYLLFCKDIELACDEKVIRNMSFQEKKEYSRVLLECSQQRRMVLSCPLAFGEVGVKERVKSVLNYKKPTFRMMCAVLIVCVMLAVLFLTNPKKETNTITTDSKEISNVTETASKEEAHRVKVYPKEEPHIVKTYEQSSDQDSEDNVLRTYHEMSDGTWTAGDYIYKYRLEVSGRLNHAAGDTTFIILSNTENITFEQAWKASGLSSNLADYFKPEDSVIVGIIFSEQAE